MKLMVKFMVGGERERAFQKKLEGLPEEVIGKFERGYFDAQFHRVKEKRNNQGDILSDGFWAGAVPIKGLGTFPLIPNSRKDWSTILVGKPLAIRKKGGGKAVKKIITSIHNAPRVRTWWNGALENFEDYAADCGGKDGALEVLKGRLEGFRAIVRFADDEGE